MGDDLQNLDLDVGWIGAFTTRKVKPARRRKNGALVLGPGFNKGIDTGQYKGSMA